MSVQDVCRVCGRRGFHENKKNKLNLFGSGNLSACLEAIIGENLGFYDGLPPFVCTTCGSKFKRCVQQQDKMLADIIKDTYLHTSQKLRKKRLLSVTPRKASADTERERSPPLKLNWQI
jgi:hypothetical protein